MEQNFMDETEIFHVTISPGPTYTGNMMEQPTARIRRASVADAGLLATLGARTFSETFDSDNRPEDMAAYLSASFSPARQAEELRDPLSIFLIAEINEQAVGYAKVSAGRAPDCVKGAQPIEIVRLYVEREWLGRAVGEALMRGCISEAQRAGYRTLWLGVWEHNERAKAFYRKWGFREVGTHIFQLGSDQQTDILMECPL
jgi:ribosomal protein S18 acetylase RimI-like enzyme